jgi:hypothetical protein
VTDVRAALLDLHRAVLRAERVALERIHGRLGGSEFLQIAADDPKLAWLLPLSELIVALDEAEAGADDAEDPAALAERARALLAPPDPETPFGRRYLSLLQRSPDVVLAHRAAGEALPPS